MESPWEKHVEASESNFLNDAIGRSSAQSGWFMFAGEEVTAAASAVVESSPEWKQLHQRIFWSAKSYLMEHIKVQGRDGVTRRLDGICYDFRYGWVVWVGQDHGFLGKVTCWDGGEIVLGRNTYLAGVSLLRGKMAIQIGAFCSIGENLNVQSSGGRHPMKTPSSYVFSLQGRDLDRRLIMPIPYAEIEACDSPTRIGNDVWIGKNVTVQAGAQIGDGCVVGEGALVRGDLKPYGVYAGFPATLKRYRFQEAIRSGLRDLEWWNWSDERILRNEAFFGTDLTTCGTMPPIVD